MKEISGGGSWIRTNVGINPADLQSAAIGHSAIPPQRTVKFHRELNIAFLMQNCQIKLGNSAHYI